MKFGLFGAATAQRSNNPDVDSSAGFRDYIDYVIEAESLGYESCFIVEHHFTGFGQVSATLNLLTWIGAKTSTIRLGTAVLVLPWHNPVLLAEQAATVDLLSGGRLDFGVGKGYRHNEYEGFRIPMEEGQARFEESIDIVTKSWTSDERFDYRGKFWSYDDIVVEPPTVQRPHPPILIGGELEKVAERVADLGDGWLPRYIMSKPADIEAGRRRIEGFYRERGRDPSTLDITLFGCRADRKEMQTWFDAGVTRILFIVHPEPPAAGLARLERLAACL